MDSGCALRDIDELSHDAGGLAAGARAAQRGARVALMMPNLPQYMVAIAAVLRAGCVVVNVNPLYTPRELEHQLKDSGAEAIVVLENFAAHAGGGDRAHAGASTSCWPSMGDLLGFWKGQLVNFAVRHVRRWCRSSACRSTTGARVTRFNDGAAPRARA